MKILKTILIVVAAIIVILLAIPLFLDKDYKVEREITINRSNQEVFDYVKMLKNQNDFSVWAKMDPNMKKDFKGTDGTVGFISAWESNHENVGKGEQEIKNIEQGKRIDYELRFKEPFESTAGASMSTEAVSETQSKVKWSFNGHMNYPMNIMTLFMDMDKMLGKDLSGGLKNLKDIMEKQPSASNP
jgi:hypothetical protein